MKGLQVPTALSYGTCTPGTCNIHANLASFIGEGRGRLATENPFTMHFGSAFKGIEICTRYLH